MPGTLEAIVQEAASRGLPFVLAGGHAVILHGVARNTFDLDLIVRLDDSERWTVLLTELGYRVSNRTSAFLQFTASEKTRLPVDLMLVNAETFEKLLAAASIAPPPGYGARYVSLYNLLALKCHAVKFGHVARIEKDLDDLIGLIKANSLNVEEPKLQELILRHGTTELYEKLKRSTK